ncbi:MAG: hypothetical protein KA135_08510 [Halioglobus sp.]|nr:hypothetical protein [Halioglobus sp.]
MGRQRSFIFSNLLAALPVAALLLGPLLSSQAVAAFEMPPKNPYLADSNYAMGHGDSAQQDAVPQAGPIGPTRVLDERELQYTFTGPGFFGINTSGVYADGRRVFWGNGLDRLVKLDYDSYQIVAEKFFPDVERYSLAQSEQSIAKFEENNSGPFAIYNAFREAGKLRDLSNIYTLLDRDNTYYVGSKSGLITAYGDQDPQDSRSPIVELRHFRLPAEVSGPIMGLNMTYDGWLIAATEHGYLVAIKRDFSDYRFVRINHSEGAENKSTGPAGYGWIRNGFAIDADGGIYIASQEHMHKVVWSGDQLSLQESDGAWSEPYLNGWGHGSGSTPTLMGFGQEDQFVVITDGQPQMNLVLFWRNAIPDGWQQLPGAPSRRIAGQLPVTMDDPGLTEIQSEQSVVVAGYGALVVNNHPRNIPWYLPRQAGAVLVSYLGSNPLHQPYGVQKFEWDPAARALKLDWVNAGVSSPSAVPIVGVGSDTVYLIGARDNQWTLEAMNWDTGESRFHYVIGGQRYNVLFAGTLLDDDGRIHYGTPWGRVRLDIDESP